MRYSLEYCNAQRPVPVSGLDVIPAGSQQPDTALRNIDLDGLLFTGLAQMKADSPARKEDLSGLVAQTRDFDLAAAGQINRIRVDADHAAGSGIGAQRCAGEDRLVRFGVRPGSPAGGSEVDITG